MIIKSCYNLVEIANEFILVPVEGATKEFNGIVALNDAAGFLLQQLKTPKTMEELVEVLIDEYIVDRVTAERDIADLVKKLVDYDVIDLS